jgi:hypothetical protein
VELDRWKEVRALVLEGLGRGARSRVAWFRLGDAFLEIVSDHDPLLQELDAIYGDCASPEPPPDALRIRCTAALVSGGQPPLLGFAFEGPHLPDLIEAARSPYRFVRRQHYVEAPGPIPGWRSLVSADADHRHFMASNGRSALVNLDEAPPESVVDWLACIAQAAHTGVLFLHAGSVGVAGSGALLIGSTGSGKSTTTLALAGRGHAFLGDDVAAVSLATRQLLPFPRSAGLRAGPLAMSLERQVRTCRPLVAVNRHGVSRTLVRVSDLFPDSGSGPLPLRFAFVLDGFAERAAVSEFRPGLAELRRLRSVVTDTSGAWGLSPGRDLLLFLSVVNLLSSLRCHVVKLGSPEETAAVIEAVMMEGECT